MGFLLRLLLSISISTILQAVVTDHWNGDYLYESMNRPDDGATIHAITTFAAGVGFYTPDSEEAASTIQ